MSKTNNFLFTQSDSRGQLFIMIYVDDLAIRVVHIVDINNIKMLISGNSRWKTWNNSITS